MMDRSNFSVGFYPLQEEAAKNDPMSSHALTKEVQERLHVLQRASCEFCAEMTEMAAESGERVFRSRELLHRLEAKRPEAPPNL
jgi:hypothetical protein